MTHLYEELARERQRSLLTEAAAERHLRRLQRQSRIARMASRAERRQVSQAHHVARLRAQLEQLASSS